jgi:uncharacterized membrane protein YraQ (UPF0718 family)
VLLDEVAGVAGRVGGQVLATFQSVWVWLLIGTVSAAALSVHLGAERIGTWLRRRTTTATAGSVGAAVFTPFCSCGTTAIVLSMIASTAPWAPIVAFMVASPLTSPAELVVSAGLFGWAFALLFFVGTTALGLVAGFVAAGADRLGWLKDQARFVPNKGCSGAEASGCSVSAFALGRPASRGTRSPLAAPPPLLAELCTPTLPNPPERGSKGPGAAHVSEFRGHWARLKLADIGRETLRLGRHMLVYFFGFAVIGYTVIELVPTDWITSWLSGASFSSILIAATAGIPLYITTDGSLPLLAGLMDGGMGPGPAMAFLVTGAGTSIGAMSGALLIARWRIVALVVGLLWVGAVGLGLLTSAVL